MTAYDQEADPAKKLFWNNVMTDAANSTSKRVAADVAKIKEVISQIKNDTEDIPWLSKFFANIFKNAGSQAELKYPSRRK